MYGATDICTHELAYRTVSKFQGSKVLHFVSLFHIQKISCGILFRGGVSCPTNYIVVGVKFQDFNPTTKLTKFKHHQLYGIS